MLHIQPTFHCWSPLFVKEGTPLNPESYHVSPLHVLNDTSTVGGQTILLRLAQFLEQQLIVPRRVKALQTERQEWLELLVQ